MKKIIQLGLAGILMSLSIRPMIAQTDSSSVDNQTMAGQITFITPMGTNGLDAPKKSNHISFNIIAGVNGGVEGIEFGGFANTLTGDMHGSQFAGFANVVKGEAEGLQAAGFANLNKGNLRGIQMAGFTNVSNEDAMAMQMAGFHNQVSGNLTGFQVAGFSNVATGELLGGQAAGFMNHACGMSKGIQMAGFANVLTADAVGSQLAGFANIVNGDIEGAQVSGFLNVAGKVNGIQVGVINVADSFGEGMPIGLFSFVKKGGYHAFEIETNELLWAQGKVKLGTERFYNIFSVALDPQHQGWAYGYGIGSRMAISEKAGISFDLLAHHVNEGELWNDALNLVVRFNPTFDFSVSRHFQLFAGPSISYQISDKWTYYNDPFHSELAPYTLLEDSGWHTDHRVWIGGNIGIRIR